MMNNLSYYDLKYRQHEYLSSKQARGYFKPATTDPSSIKPRSKAVGRKTTAFEKHFYRDFGSLSQHEMSLKPSQQPCNNDTFNRYVTSTTN